MKADRPTMEAHDAGVQLPPPPVANRPRTPSLAANVVANWTWSLLVIASGFILPRTIARYEGQVLLGVWDLGLSLLFYVGLLKMNAGGAVSRYVSRYRALQDWESLNATVNCSLAFLLSAAGIGLVVALGLCAYVHTLVPEATSEVLAKTRWVVLLLAVSAALELPIGALNAVITGCERFDVLNWIRGLRDIGVFLIMILLLVAGGGIVSLAIVALAGTIVHGIAEWIAARRLCPQLQFSPTHFSWRVMRKVAIFGGKSMSRDVSRSVLYQVNSVLVAAFLGPAVLAVYTRQRNLVMQVMKLVKQFAQVFIPSSSGLDARRDWDGLRKQLLESAQYGMYITLPLMLILIILGGPLVHIWMGPDYVAPMTLGILALGHVLSIAQLGPYAVLEGMGRHGRPALFELAGAGIGVGLTFVGLSKFGWSMNGAALCVALSVGLSTGLAVPLYACRLLKMPVGEYVRSVVPKPMMLSMPLVVCLLAARWFFVSDPLWAVVSGLSVGGLVTAAAYWTWVVPDDFKARLLGSLANRMGLKRGESTG